MKASWAVFVSILLFSMSGCGGGGGGSGGGTPPPGGGGVTTIPGGTATLGIDTQTVMFNIVNGLVGGLVADRDVSAPEVNRLCFSSPRLGDGISTTSGRCVALSGATSDPVVIPGTADNDQGDWYVGLTDGSIYWFNPADWNCNGAPCKMVDGPTGGVIEYGDYKKEAMTFEKSKLIMAFNSNVLSGIVTTRPGDPPGTPPRIFDPGEVTWIRCVMTSGAELGDILRTDAVGHHYVEIQGIPDAGSIRLYIVMQDGLEYQVNPDMWDLGPNAVMNPVEGVIEYAL